MTSAWSHGTSSSTMVRVPWMLGSNTILRPLISWIKRKKSFKSTSFKLTDIGSPVNLGRADVEGVAAAVATVSAGLESAWLSDVAADAVVVVAAATSLAAAG